MTLASPAAATDQIDSVDYPTRRDEAWRYAPHDTLGRLRFGSPAAPAAEVIDEVDGRVPVLDGPQIVIVNGVVDVGRSQLGALPEGVRVTDLAGAITEHAGVVGSHFDRADEGVADAFVALNIAHGRDGAVVEVDPGHDVATPIHIVDIAIPDETGLASCSGVTIELAAGASATVVETRIGAGTGFGGSNTRTTIVLADDASLEHLIVQDAPTAQVQLTRVEATQGPRSLLNARSFNLGASYGRITYNIDLAGDGARAELSGLYFGLGDQVLDQQVSVSHSAPNCTSRQVFRGVLDDRSIGVFNGGIDVRPGADGTDAEQSNDNLLLSKRAEVNTQPRLEILADDVACKHGATVGQLDDEALYYLRTRGIASDDARRLLIRGFADHVVEQVTVEPLRTWITERLGHGDA